MAELLLAGCEIQAHQCQNLQDPPLGRGAWNRLLQKSETPSVFLTWQWLAAWWECFSDGAQLFAFAVERGGELIGIAPLMVRRQDGWRDVEFLGMGSSDYCDIIASEDDKPEVVQAVVEALVRRRDRWDRVRLRYLPAASSTARLLSELVLPQGWQLQSEVESSCPALSIETSPSFAAACTRKKSLVRHARYFDRLAPLEFRHSLDVDEILDHLPAFFEQHRDRRFMAGDISLFDDPRHRRFYERMVPALLESNWLRFGILRWRDEVLAYHLGFLYNGVFTWYKPTFNLDHAHYSPGEVLLLKLLEEAIAGGVRVFDFTVGDESFKERFANVKNENLCVQILQQGRRRRLHAAMREDVKGYVKRRHPAVFARLKAMPAVVRAAGMGAEQRLDWVSTRIPGGAAGAPRPSRAPFEVVMRVLWRAAPMQPVPSEFSAQWARYSDLKELTRREGLQQEFLLGCLARLQRGERAVVASWPERPVALLWLARDAAPAVAAAGLGHEIEPEAALATAGYLATDLRGSPRREALPQTLLTFLAAEGVTALYGVHDTRQPAPLLAQCGADLVPIERRLEVKLLRWRGGFRHRFAPQGEA